MVGHLVSTTTQRKNYEDKLNNLLILIYVRQKWCLPSLLTDQMHDSGVVFIVTGWLRV